MSVRDWTPSQRKAVLKALRGSLRARLATARRLYMVPAELARIRDPLGDVADLIEAVFALDLVDPDLDELDQALEDHGDDDALEALDRVRLAIEAARA